MVNTQFGEILKTMEAFFHCPLGPDANDSCLINMGSGLSLQIELDSYGLILMGCRLGNLYMGRYRNDLIRAALKSNASTLPSTGVFGFSQKSNQLILFIKINPLLFSVDQMLRVFPPFLEKAKQWKEAFEQGEIPTIKSPSSSNRVSGLFGLIS